LPRQSLHSGRVGRATAIAVPDGHRRRVIAALVAHTPSQAPLASNVKFTEQAQMLKVGEGLWKTTTQGPTTFKIAVADPIAGHVGMIVMMKAELGPPPVNPITGTAPPVPPGPADVQLAFRLKVQKKQITEAEHIYARITAASQLANLQKPRAAFFASVPPAQRSSRDIMLLIGNAYYDSLMQSDGEAAPFAEDCARRENGMHTAGVGAPPPQPGALPMQGCAEQLTSRAMSYITSIDLRRVWIADEETGPMTEKFVTILNPDGTTTQRPWSSTWKRPISSRFQPERSTRSKRWGSRSRYTQRTAGARSFGSRFY
jgi:hypothetical protein